MDTSRRTPRATDSNQSSQGRPRGDLAALVSGFPQQKLKRRPQDRLPPEFNALEGWKKMGQCLKAPYSHWLTPTQRQLQLHRPNVYFALLAVRQRDPLKDLCLCRIAVNRLSQSLHRQFVRDSQR